MTLSPAYQDLAEPVDPRFSDVPCVFFVIGAQKAGTTWLSHYFKMHPNIAVPEWKEHDYWNMVEGRPNASRMLRAQMERRKRKSVMRDIVAAIPFTLHARRQRAITLALKAVEAPYPPYSAYADVLLERCDSNTQAAGEICPEYALLRAETYGRMARLNKNVRFIYLMRDPVSRFISHVRHSLRKQHGAKNVSEDILSEALRKYASVPTARPFRMSDYRATIEALEQEVAPDHIRYLFFESLFDQEQVRGVCDFLSVPFVKAPVDRRRNIAEKNAAPVRAEDRALLAQVLRPVYDFVDGRFSDRVPPNWRKTAQLC